MTPHNCSACGSTNQAGAQFCANCGRQLTSAAPVTHVLNAHSCPTCLSPLRAGARFCANCGTSLTGGPPPVLKANPKECPHCQHVNHSTATICSNCGTLLAGHVLDGRYRIQKMLGRGGFGAVYLTENIRLERECVVKQMLLPDRNALSPKKWQKQVDELRRNFKREARSLTSLNKPGHPNIPEIYDFFDDASGNYLVMKYIEGESLEKRLTGLRQPLPWREAVDIALKMASALEYMHSRVAPTGKPAPVLHRDIKPDNILIGKGGRIWLVDFGLSKAQPTTVITGTIGATTAAGTPGYPPKEQWLQKAASDVYALGATLHHLVTGRPPYADFTQFDIFTVIRHHANFPPIRSLNKALPAALEKIIAAAVQDKPEDRPSTKEFKEQLEKLIRPRLTVRPFTWQDGTQSDMPDELPPLANQHWAEAKGYLYGGKWLRWFEDDLKRNDMAALVGNATQHKNQDIGLDTFLRALESAFPAPKLQLKSATLDFGAVPWQIQSTQPLEIRNLGSGCLHGRITNIPSWLRVTPSEFATHERQPIKLTVDGNSLSPRPQPYTTTLTIDAGIGGKTSLPLAVIVPEPQLRLKPANLNLGSAYQGETLTGTFTVHNTGGSAFEGSIHCDAPWATISPTSLRCEPGESKSVEVEADTSQLRMGGHSGRVSVQAKAGAWEQTVQTKVSVRLPWLKTFWRRWAPTLDWAAVGMVLGVVYVSNFNVYTELIVIIFPIYILFEILVSFFLSQKTLDAIRVLCVLSVIIWGAWLRSMADTWLGFRPTIALAGLGGMILWGIVYHPNHSKRVKYRPWSGIFALLVFVFALAGMIYLAIQPS